jgi:hypothetical protein
LTVVLLPRHGREIALKSFRAGRRAAFRVRVRVPRSVSAGAAMLGVRGRELDKRLECPRNADCAYFGARVVITR